MSDLSENCPPRSAFWIAYGTGALSNGMTDMFAVVVPLWALSIGMPPTEIGLIVGARGILPLIFGIHMGVLIDRIGTRQVLMTVALVASLLSLLYPLSPWFWTLFVLQMVVGFGTITGFICGQAMIGQLAQGDTQRFAYFTFSSRFGTFSGPILTGILWDFTGPWGAFLFIAMWGSSLFALAYFSPMPPPPSGKPLRKPRLSDLIPKPSDYKSSFALLGIPAVALAISITLLRSTTSGIQDSFYIVHLNSIGLTGTTIGILISVCEISSGLGSLTAAKVERFLAPHWILIFSSILAILFIAVTPIVSGFVVLLIVFQVLRGLSQGIMQPVGYSILSNAAGPGSQGAVMGLRMTGTRFMNTVLPPIMGVAVEIWGIEAGFYLVGGILIIVLLLLALVTARSPSFPSLR